MKVSSHSSHLLVLIRHLIRRVLLLWLLWHPHAALHSPIWLLLGESAAHRELLGLTHHLRQSHHLLLLEHLLLLVEHLLLSLLVEGLVLLGHLLLLLDHHLLLLLHHHLSLLVSLIKGHLSGWHHLLLLLLSWLESLRWLLLSSRLLCFLCCSSSRTFTLVVRFPSGLQADLSRHFVLVHDVKPVIKPTRLDQNSEFIDRRSNCVTCDVVFIEDCQSEIVVQVFDLQVKRLVPLGGLARTVEGPSANLLGA